ncbi:MAG: aminotransferase class I/II-fold pyridoxal phosphate-dependent enzyme [Crocinitomicaceae bacterium]|nr:aminotransferase class I/II-fold pyridoxal phosphate-dependent enzyme [Crocinitomicaceae bacterium]
MIDLRSDTVTKPTKEMLDFMMKAEVGDDVFGDDPTVNELEKFGASMFGKEAGLYCSSGTQTNQIAINVHCQPGDEIICHEESHIYRYEGGGIMRNSGTSVRLLRGNSGRINPDEIAVNINPDDQHYPVTKMVSIEDTSNRGGGVVYDFNDIQKISSICKEKNLKFHLDGARVFNALTVTGIDLKIYGSQFDTISVCLSKSLGAPVGSLLLGPADFIKKARRVRKVFGGGMRQAGIIAAGGLYALKNNIDRLKEDHQRAKEIEQILSQAEWIKSVIPAETNIVVGNLTDGLNELEVVEKLKEHGILAVGFGRGRIRMVTHLDIRDTDIISLKNQLPIKF